MKLKFWRLVLGIFVLGVCIILLSYLLIESQQEVELPLTAQYGIRFGSSSQRVNAVFGEPVKTEKNVCDTGKTMRVYKAVILGKDAEIACYFSLWNKLVDMDIQWEFDSEEDTWGFLENATDIIAEAYKDHEDFFRTEMQKDSSGEYSMTMGLDDGATGNIYVIYLSDMTLCILCIHNY